MYLYVSNRKHYRYRSDKELMVVELINRWRCCLQVGNGGKFLLGYHGNGCSTNKNAGLFCLYILYRCSVQEASLSDSYLQRASMGRCFSSLNRVKTFFEEFYNSRTAVSTGFVYQLKRDPHEAADRVNPHGYMN